MLTDDPPSSDMAGVDPFAVEAPPAEDPTPLALAACLAAFSARRFCLDAEADAGMAAKEGAEPKNCRISTKPKSEH